MYALVRHGSPRQIVCGFAEGHVIPRTAQVYGHKDIPAVHRTTFSVGDLKPLSSQIMSERLCLRVWHHNFIHLYSLPPQNQHFGVRTCARTQPDNVNIRAPTIDSTTFSTTATPPDRYIAYPASPQRYLIAIPCGRAGPEENALLKSRLKRESRTRSSFVTRATWTL